MTLCSVICPDCPFQREARPGHPQGVLLYTFLPAALSDSSVSCHAEYERLLENEPDRTDTHALLRIEREAPRCRGAAIMRKNQLKEPRDPEVKRLVARLATDPAIFQWNDEFIFHHAAGSDADPNGGFDIVAVYVGGLSAKRSVRAKTRKKARAIMLRLLCTHFFSEVYLRHWRTNKGRNTYVVLASETLTLDGLKEGGE